MQGNFADVLDIQAILRSSFRGGDLGVFLSVNTNKATWFSFCVIYRLLRVTKVIGQKLKQMAMVRRRYRWSWD